MTEKFPPKAIKYGDLGTSESIKQKGRVITIADNGQVLARVKKISVLHEYLERNYINTLQYSAGCELSRCYVEGITSIFPRGTNYVDMASGKQPFSGLMLTEKQVALIAKYQKALKYIDRKMGVEMDAYEYTNKWFDPVMVLTKVCCDDAPVGNNLHWKRRKEAMAILKEALDHLAHFFGMRT